MAGLTVELVSSSDPALLLNFFLEHPKGATIEEVSAATSLSENKIRWTAARLGVWFVNVSGKRRGNLMRFAYRPLDPTFFVATPTAIAPPATAGKGDGAAVATVSQPSPRTSAETEIAWPGSPPIPDVKKKYGFFEAPEWFRRLESKILKHGKNISLSGPPGIGKSAAFEFLAARETVPLVNISADAGLRARQLIGGMTDNGRFEVSQFAAAVVKGWWAKVDEVNGADPDALLFLNSILAPPYEVTIHGRTYPVHPEFRMAVTYNPGLVGTKPLPDSLKDRLYPFKVKFPTRSRLEKMVAANGVAISSDVSKVLDFAIAVVENRNMGKHKFDMTMRRILDAVSDLDDGIGVKDALYNACVDRIDNPIDAAVISQLLDTSFPKS